MLYGTIYLLMFFSMFPPQPRLTLSPYTTLFRSHPGNNAVRLSIHQAVASNSTPKPYLMRFIHSPALGIQRLEVAPTTSSNTPEPQAKANNVNPPTTTSPVWEINNNTPANGAATQGPTMRADNIPITNTPPKRPAGKRFKRPCKRACMPAGACKVYTSNMDKASNANKTAKLINTQGFCNHMAKLAPTKPATIPSKVYTTDTPNTYTAAIDSPRRLESAWSVSFCPAIMLNKIGTIGKTQR